MADYGYARVSTVEQNEARQLATFYDEYNIDKDHIFIDKCSGKNADRPALKKMLETLQPGDRLIVKEFARLGRNTIDLLQITDSLTAKQIDIVSDKEKIDTTTSTGRFMLTVIAAMAQFERAMILERQKEGIELAKKEKKYTGRKPIEVDKELVRMTCEQYIEGKITSGKACKLITYTDRTGQVKNISTSKFYKLLDEYMLENNIKRYTYLRNVDDPEVDDGK